MRYEKTTKRGSHWQQLAQARLAREHACFAHAPAAKPQALRWWQRAISVVLAMTLFVGPITVTVEQSRSAAGTVAAGSRRLDDEAWQRIYALASVRVKFAVQMAEATPIVDPTAPITFQPKITQSTGSGGGVPVVNITAPNAAGISLNQYQSFNIDPVGLILNNSLMAGTTLTGGNVSANPNFGGRTASVIVNQVTSTGAAYASLLNGPLEVFGAPAVVVIANPNGIATQGTGFTNTIGVTLTTGMPQFLTAVGGSTTDFAHAGALGYSVSGGHIQIEGNPGVNGPGAGIEGTVGTIDLIGETIGVNAPLYAGNQINAIAGRQFVLPTSTDTIGTTYATSANGATNTAAAINAANGNANQGYAIDATAYGAVTAGRIAVVGTAAGMGVRTDGALSATASGLTLSSNGDLTVASHAAQQEVSMTSAGNTTVSGTGVSGASYRITAGGDIVSSGTVQSNTDVGLTAGNAITVSGKTTAQTSTVVTAGTDTTVSGTLASGTTLSATVQGTFSVPGTVLVGTDATVSANAIDAAGVVIAQGNGALTAQTAITGAGSYAIGQSATLKAGTDVALTGKLLSNALTVGAGNSVSLADVQAGGAVNIAANAGDATFNGNAATVGATTVHAARDVVVNGTLAGGAQVAVTAQRSIAVNASGTVQSVGDTALTATTGDIVSTGAISSAGALAAQASHDVAITGATSAVGGTKVVAGNDLTLGGSVAGQGNAVLSAGRDANVGGTTGFGKDVSLSTGRDLLTTGSLQGNAVTLNAGNSATLAYVQANGGLHIVTNGTAGGGDLTVNGNVASLSSGTVQAARDVLVNGSVATASSLGVTAGRNTTIAGAVRSNGDIQLVNHSGSVTSSGAIAAGGDLSIVASNAIALAVNGGSASNTSALGNVSLTAGQNLSVDGTLVSQGNGTLQAGGALTGAGSLAFGLVGALASAGDTNLSGSLRAGSIQTQAGGSAVFHDVQAGSTLSLNAQGNLTTNGAVNGGATIGLTAGQDLTVGGSLQSADDATFAARNGTVNATGTIDAQGALSVQAGTDIAFSGTTTVARDAMLNATRDVTVSGAINGQGNGTVTAGRDIAGAGTLGFTGAATLTAGRNTAQAGLIQGNGVQVSSGSDTAVNNVESASALNLAAGTSGVGNLTVNGSAGSAGALSAIAAGNVTVAQTGKLASGATALVQAANDLNVAGAIESVGDATLMARLGSLNATGGINSGGKLSVTTALDASLGASTTAVGDLSINAGRDAMLNGTLVGLAGGTFTAGRDIVGAGKQSLTNDATLSAQRSIALTGKVQAKSVSAVGGDSAALNNVSTTNAITLQANGTGGNGDASITGAASAGGNIAVTAARDAIVSGSAGSGVLLTLTGARNVTATGGLTSVGDLTVTATTGSATLSGATASGGAVNVTSGLDALLGGTISATNDLTATAGRDVLLAGAVSGQANANLTASRDVTGAGTGTFGQSVTVNATHDVALTGSLQGTSIGVTGGNNAGLGSATATTGSLSVVAQGTAGGGDATLSGAGTAKQAVTVQASRDVSVAGALNAGTQTTITAGRNATLAGINSTGDLTITAAGGITQTGVATTNGNLTATAGNDLSMGSALASGQLKLSANGNNGAGDVTVAGAVGSGGALNVTAARDVSVAGNVSSGDTLTMTGARHLQVGGSIDSGADAMLTATAGNLSVTGSTTSVGALSAASGGTLALNGALVNGDTVLTSGGAMTLTGALYGLGAANVTAGGALDGGASLTYAKDISVNGASSVVLGAINGAGQLAAVAGGDLTLGATTAVGNVTATSKAGSVTVNGGLQSGGTTQILAANNATVTGAISSTGAVNVTGTNGAVTVGGVSTNGDATLTAGGKLTLSGTSVVAGQLALTGGDVTVNGSATGSQNVTVTAQGTLDSSQGQLVSTKDMQLSGTNVTLGNVLAGGNLTANAKNQMTLAGKTVGVVGNATLSSQHAFSNSSNVLSGGTLNVSAESLTNNASGSFASTNATVIQAGSFNNAGLVNGKTTNVTVSGALTNSGSLMGLNALSINTGTLNNQGGLIFAGDPNTPNGPTTGDFSLTINGAGSAFNNAGGQMLAQRDMTIGAVNAAFDPSLGTISQGGALSLTAGTISIGGTWNYGGQSVSINGINGITNGGTMTGTAPLTISTGGTFANYGQVVGQDVTFNGSLFNAGGAVMHAGGALAINGNTTNRGTVESAGALTVSGGSYDNQGATTQTQGSATFNLGGTLLNTGGSIFAGNDVTIKAGAVVNDQTAPTGSTTTTVINDPNVLWSSVVGGESWGVVGWSAGGDGSQPTLVNGGATARLGDLLSPTGLMGPAQIVFGGTHFTVLADGTLIDPNGNATNNLCSPLGLDCTSLSPSPGTPVAGSGSVTFSQFSVPTGYMGDSSQMGYALVWLPEAGPTPGQVQSVTLALPTVYETKTTQQVGTSGVISAGGSISLTANSLSNRGGNIAAQRNVSLNVQALINGAVAPTLTSGVTHWVDPAQFSSFLNALRSAVGGDSIAFECGDGCSTQTLFQLSSGSAGTSTSSLTWSTPTGMVAAGNNLTVGGGNLVNGGLLYAGNDVVVNAASLSNQGGSQQNLSSQVGCASGVPNAACNSSAGTPRGTNPTTTTFSYSQNDATIFAGHDLVIAAGQVDNTFANLLAGHDIVVGGVGTTASSTTPASSLNNTSGNIVAGNNITLNISGAITNNLPPPVPVHQNYGSKEQYTGCMTAGGYKESYCEAYVDQQSGTSSVISAGNNLKINAGSLTNIGSLISAGSTATINVAGPVINEAQTLNAYWHSHWVQETGDFSSDKRHDIWACGSTAECIALYGAAYTHVGGSINPPQPVGNIAATIEAPNLTITSGGEIQNVGNVLGTSVALTGQRLINGITTSNTYTPRVNGPSQVISLSPATLPGLNISLPRAVGTGAVPTAVAGQASFVDASLGGTSQTTYSPQVLLSNLPSNLQPSSTLFYYNPQEEDLLLQQAALQQTGKATFVDGLSYDSQNDVSVTEQEKAYLYGNALDYAKTNNVQLGQALTQAQVTALDRPMLWYVEQTVPDPSCSAVGKDQCPTITALMPQVYLPSTTTALSAGGNIIGQDVTLNFEGKGQGSVLNTGTISASGTLKVDTPTLTNEANQVDVGHIWSKVKGGYLDTTGTEVQPGGFMSAANMDLNVQTLNQIGGALQKLNADGTVDQAGTQQFLAALGQDLGANFTQQTLTDHLHSDFVAQGGFGVGQLATMVLAVAMTMMGMPILGAMLASAMNQLISGQGLDIGKVLEAGAVAYVTAGLTDGLDTAIGAPQLSQIGSDMANGVAGASEIAEGAAEVVGNAAISASVNTLAYGGSFGRAFENAAISNLAAVGAGAIGGASVNENSWLAKSSPGYVLAHAGLGCAVSAAEGTGCAGGAIGGAASALVAPYLVDQAGGAANLTDGQRAAIVGTATLLGGLAAGFAGYDAQAGANAAQNEALNNSTEKGDSPFEREQEAEKKFFHHIEEEAGLGGSGTVQKDGETIRIDASPPLLGGDKYSALQQAQNLISSRGQGTLQIGGASFASLPNNGNAAMFSGATDEQVQQYFMDLSGASEMPPARVVQGQGSIYVVKTPQGNFTLRDFAGSSGQTGPVWTIDIPGGAVGKTYNPEIKFLRKK